MYRVLLVDDESMARVGLRSTFDWEGNGFQLVGEASNGKRAMKWIENDEIDILITDIAMPVMDGLELTKLTRKLRPRVKVLLLSCHNEYEYLREGLRLGASDYLLKATMEPEDLRKVLEEIKLEVIKEKEKLTMMNKIKEQADMDHQVELEKNLYGMLFGQDHGGIHPEMAWMVSGYRMMVCLSDCENDVLHDNQYTLDTIQIKQIFYKYFKIGLACGNSPRQINLLFPALGGQKELEQLEEFRIGLAKECYSVTLGISQIYREPAQIKEAYSEGKNNADLRFFMGPDRLISGQVNQTENSKMQQQEITPQLFRQLKELISAEFKDKASLCLDQLIAAWDSENKDRKKVMQEAQELIFLFYSFKEANTKTVMQIEALMSMQYKNEVIKLIREIFSSLWVDEELNETVHQRIVSQAMEYIHQHFFEAISLKDVADEVSISKNYLSELFKRVTGQNFIDYLIQLRIKRAKELFNTTTFKVYEVAEISGFNDVKHFSKLFKKMVGISPAEFQGGKK